MLIEILNKKILQICLFGTFNFEQLQENTFHLIFLFTKNSTKDQETPLEYKI